MKKEELLELIRIGEGYALEFKESLPSDLGKHICAFANASGGRIIIGVADDSRIIGHILKNKEKSQVIDIARNMSPSFHVEAEQIGNITVINVPEGNNKPYSVHGHFYLRMGSNSQQLNRDEIKELFQSEGLVVFDEKKNNEFDINKNFNKRAYQTFLERAGIKTKLPSNKLLENMGFIKEQKMNNAGVLFFCKDTSKFFLNANITCALFQGDTKAVILDKQEYSFDLVTNYERAVEYLKAKLNTEYFIRLYRKEFLELPENALRESILNAIAHRDYFSSAHTQVNIFKNSVEIINPAKFPQKITIDDMMKGSHPKNNFLFSMMQRADLVEKVGSGIGRIKESMEKYKLKEPLFEYDGVWFRVVFNRPDMQKNSYQARFGLESAPAKVGEKVGEKVGVNEKNILQLVQKNSQVTYKELSEKVGIAEKNIYANIEKLKKKGLLKRVGPDKGGYWKVIKWKKQNQ